MTTNIHILYVTYSTSARELSYDDVTSRLKLLYDVRTVQYTTPSRVMTACEIVSVSIASIIDNLSVKALT